MLIRATSLINKQIRSIRDGSFIGRIADIVIDPATGKLLAYKMKSKNKIVSTIDIAGYTPLFLVARDSDVLISTEEIIKVKKILDERINVIENKVITKSGKRLGTCEDVIFDEETSSMIKIYVKANLFGSMLRDLIIPSSSIVSITKQAIVVKDIGEKSKQKALAGALAEPS